MIFLKTVLNPVEKVLKDSKTERADVVEVVLVGGSTRIPKVQSLLQDFFGGKSLNKSINPDEAVAVGAAIQAAILGGTRDKKLTDILLLDVAPLSLGIETEGGVMSTVIKRNSTVPITKSQIFTTTENNQRVVTIHVFEGERPTVKDNNSLGKFDLHGIPPAPKGKAQILVTFDIDSNGILCVSAKEEATGSSGKITITNDSGRLSPAEVEKMVRDAEKYAEADKRAMEKVAAKNELEEYIFRVKESMEEEGVKKKLTNVERNKVNGACDETMAWLDDTPDSTAEQLKDKQKGLERFVGPMMAKLYK